MRRLLSRVVALGGVLAGLSAGLVGSAPEAGAVTGVQTGYWQQRPGVAQVPAGGFEVASDPTGTQAVAAIRFTLDSGESQPILHLKLAQVLPDTSQLAVIACAVSAGSSSWQPPSGAGAWANAPKPDCSGGSATGKLSSDGTTLTFDLSVMSFDGSTVDMLLQPDLVTSPVPGGVVSGVGGQGPPSFDAAFAPATPAEIEVSSGGSSASGATGTGSTGTGSTGSVSAAAPPSAALGAALPAGSGVAPAVDPGAGAAAPVVAPVQQGAAQQPVAAQGAFPLQRSRNLRLLFAVAMLSADLLFGVLWLQRKYEASPESRPLLSIYDPPPA